MGGDSKFLRPTSFGKNPKTGFYRLNPYSVSEKPNHFQKESNLFETCCFENEHFLLKKENLKKTNPRKRKSPHRSRRGGIFQIPFAVVRRQPDSLPVKISHVFLSRSNNSTGR